MGSESFWSERRVWITGASSGIGRAIAERLDPLGARLALTARREASLRQLAESLSGEAVVAAADVSDLGQMQSAGARVAAELGDVDVLIACAGVYRLTDGRQWDAATVNEVLRINVEGVSNAIAVVAPSMVQRGAGHIAAVSSLAGLAPMPGGAAYCASKAALIALLDSLRLDLRQAGVKVTTIAPGYVDTPMITDEERQTLHDLVTADDAARRCCEAIARGQSYAAFPWRTRWLVKLAQRLPRWLYDRIMADAPPMAESIRSESASDVGGHLQADDAADDQRDE